MKFNKYLLLLIALISFSLSASSWRSDGFYLVNQSDSTIDIKADWWNRNYMASIHSAYHTEVDNIAPQAKVHVKPDDNNAGQLIRITVTRQDHCPNNECKRPHCLLDSHSVSNAHSGETLYFRHNKIKARHSNGNYHDITTSNSDNCEDIGG